MKQDKVGVMGQIEIMLCLPEMNGNEMIRFQNKLIAKDIAQSLVVLCTKSSNQDPPTHRP